MTIDKNFWGSVIPLIAIAITLAEFLYDHTQPRWHSPWFWAGLLATVGLLVAVQVLRRMTPKKPPPTIGGGTGRTVITPQNLSK